MCSWYKCKVFRINVLSVANIRKRINFGGSGGLNIRLKISGLVKFTIKRNVFSLMLYQVCLLPKNLKEIGRILRGLSLKFYLSINFFISLS